MPAIEKLSSGHRNGKGQFSFQFQRKVMPKNAQTTAQLNSVFPSSCEIKYEPAFKPLQGNPAFF